MKCRLWIERVLSVGLGLGCPHTPAYPSLCLLPQQESDEGEEEGCLGKGYSIKKEIKKSQRWGFAVLLHVCCRSVYELVFMWQDDEEVRGRGRQRGCGLTKRWGGDEVMPQDHRIPCDILGFRKISWKILCRVVWSRDIGSSNSREENSDIIEVWSK